MMQPGQREGRVPVQDCTWDHDKSHRLIRMAGKACAFYAVVQVVYVAAVVVGVAALLFWVVG